MECLKIVWIRVVRVFHALKYLKWILVTALHTFTRIKNNSQEKLEPMNELKISQTVDHTVTITVRFVQTTVHSQRDEGLTMRDLSTPKMRSEVGIWVHCMKMALEVGNWLWYEWDLTAREFRPQHREVKDSVRRQTLPRFTQFHSRCTGSVRGRSSTVSDLKIFVPSSL